MNEHVRWVRTVKVGGVVAVAAVWHRPFWPSVGVSRLPSGGRNVRVIVGPLLCSVGWR